MHKTIWNHRHVAALALAALLAGCGGGGGGGGSAATCTANCTTVTLANSDGSPVSGIYPSAINQSTGQICATSSNATSSAGSTVLSLTNCDGSTATVIAPVGSGIVAGSCTVGQSCTLRPGTTNSTATYQGTWTAQYSSSLTTGDSGKCTVILNANGVIVDSSGNTLTETSAKNCHSNLGSQNDFVLMGTLYPDGSFSGSATSGAVYKGSFSVGTTTSAGGQWNNAAANTSGTWSATRTGQ